MHAVVVVAVAIVAEVVVDVDTWECSMVEMP